jgi:amino-acid N-acetyltransferase
MALSVTRAMPGDAEAIAELLTASALPLDGALACLGNAVVARADGVVVGCAALELFGVNALLRSVAVDVAVRRGGIGRRLTAAAMDLAAASGISTVYLLTTTAEPYFAALGFESVSRDVVPAALRASVEFTSACPATATVMRRRSRG